MTALQAIRAKCIDCMCGNKTEVARCPCTECPLFPYRDGHNPARKGVGGKGNYDALKRFQERKKTEGM